MSLMWQVAEEMNTDDNDTAPPSGATNEEEDRNTSTLSYPLQNEEIIASIGDDLTQTAQENRKRTRTLSSTAHMTERLATSLTLCLICLDAVLNGERTPCGHIFCRSCIDRVLGYMGQCPTCNTTVWLTHLRRWAPMDRGSMVDQRNNLRVSGSRSDGYYDGFYHGGLPEMRSES